MKNTQKIHQFQLAHEVITDKDIMSFIRLGYKRVGHKGMQFQIVLPEDPFWFIEGEVGELRAKYAPYCFYDALVYMTDGVITDLHVINTKSDNEVEQLIKK